MKFLSMLLSAVFVIAIITLVQNSTTSQNDLSHFYEDNNYIDGEIIVVFKNNIDANSFMAEYDDIGLSLKEVLVPEMNIYLFQYDNTRSQPVDALLSVMRNSNVSIAQFNHRFRERVVPNDTRFAEQWDKNNTGQSGGTVDADIDAPEAWNISTGGVTAYGDTIVVAIVDGGQQVTHTDLDTWRNRGETAGNGIDDDGNGYIDDINGWNAGSNNGTIPSNQHGTHCAGIVGAKGNNSLGVAGVNWKVKTMPIVYGSATESNVIKAYGYALKQRKIYNQTNGAQGAFVVSTNSSFGIDYGRPVNYPLWCAFYDSLGNAGILSAGAGPNLNINIDTQGDIPTTCPSKYMIAVTNTTRTDARNSGAGYGSINMDLGAPGTSILSTVPTNNYGSLTGTSMATPQVAGAIALLHAGAHSYYMQLMKNDPDSAAELFKQFILSTVDTIPSMNGVTVSNGRLNLSKLLLKANTVNTAGVLNLHALIEGFYDAVSDQMVSDTVMIYVRSGSSPYSIIDSSKSVVDINSFAAVNFSNIYNSTPYYIVLKHRNSIETWSSSAQNFVSNALNYDFTNAGNKAYGSNMKQVGTAPVKFGIYSGDVNQNGNVDLNDVLEVYNAANDFSSGYIVSDLTGDNLADLDDLLFAYNNSVAFVNVVKP
ncbi:MAG: S8 family serine peptidase [Ignavibacteria bacterium]|nr:S8 family serine peptidase [Ignavibacteria bacterium]